MRPGDKVQYTGDDLLGYDQKALSTVPLPEDYEDIRKGVGTLGVVIEECGSGLIAVSWEGVKQGHNNGARTGGNLPHGPDSAWLVYPSQLKVVEEV